MCLTLVNGHCGWQRKPNSQATVFLFEMMGEKQWGWSTRDLNTAGIRGTRQGICQGKDRLVSTCFICLE